MQASSDSEAPSWRPRRQAAGRTLCDEGWEAGSCIGLADWEGRSAAESGASPEGVGMSWGTPPRALVKSTGFAV